jgi:hypothetical protein
MFIILLLDGKKAEARHRGLELRGGNAPIGSCSLVFQVCMVGHFGRQERRSWPRLAGLSSSGFALDVVLVMLLLHRPIRRGT